jgi:N-acetylglutamate synthase-like GNAT family acetyltransferase
VPLSDIERVTAFDIRFAKAQATQVVELPWGFAVLQRDFPLSEYHNRVTVTSAASGTDVLAAADDILGGSGLQHRYVCADDEPGQAMHDELVAAGYEHETILTMIYNGAKIVGPPGPTVRVVTLEELWPALVHDWGLELPGATEEHLRQLAERTALYEHGADVTFLAVYDGDEIVARADLYIDRVDNIAQFENLGTRDQFRGRGYANALIHEALRRSHEVDARLCFLTAALDDWPREWYARLGYAEAARTHHFARHAPE